MWSCTDFGSSTLSPFSGRYSLSQAPLRVCRVNILLHPCLLPVHGITEHKYCKECTGATQNLGLCVYVHIYLYICAHIWCGCTSVCYNRQGDKTLHLGLPIPTYWWHWKKGCTVTTQLLVLQGPLLPLKPLGPDSLLTYISFMPLQLHQFQWSYS